MHNDSKYSYLCTSFDLDILFLKYTINLFVFADDKSKNDE